MNTGTAQAQQEIITTGGDGVIWSHSEWNEDLSEAMSDALMRLEEKAIERARKNGHSQVVQFNIIARNDTFSQVDDMWTVSLTAKIH